MKLCLSALIIFTLFGAHAFANNCDIQTVKPWQNLIVQGTGEDYGEEGHHPDTYIRRPSQKYAINAALADLKSEIEVCKRVCEMQQGAFVANEAMAKKCHFEQSYPRFWTCAVGVFSSCQ